MSETAESLVGTELDGRYRLTSFIEEGGMGRVYRGVQNALDRTVAIKLLKDPPSVADDFQRRFFLEASLCARLTHPNTIRIFDYGCCAQTGHYYIVMEFLEGRTVRQVLRDEGALPPLDAIELVRQVCAALIEAHAAGLVHRDLKPSNLFACPDGMGGRRIKILDFGVVKQIDADVEITQVQSILGSPQYMPPEQARGLEVDGRSDLYSLGAILFQLLTGRVPFSGRDPMAVVMKHLTNPLPVMRDINSLVEVPEALEELVRRAMAKQPEHRFSGAREMLEALDAIERSLTGHAPSTARIPSTERAFREMETGLIDPDDLLTDAAPCSSQESEVETMESVIDTLKSVSLDGYRAYIDLNCPYCYALYERVCRWGLVDQIEWCTIEHAAHVLDGEFDLRQEEMLTAEVFEVHHRAPDIDLTLPPDRCQSTLATRMLAIVYRLFPEVVNDVRRAIYGALWQAGHNIGDRGVLEEILRRHEVPEEVLGMCDEEPPEFIAWQRDWEQGGYDNSIPVLTHKPTGRVLIGLADQSSLARFLLGDRMRVIDRTVCFYQRKPTLLLCGWMNHMWALLSEINSRVEVIQAPTARRAAEVLAEHAVPDLFLIEDEHVSAEDCAMLAELARSRSVPWLMATQSPDEEREIEALSAGAVEYLPIVDDARVARARLQRILQDRFRMSQEARHSDIDPLTRLPGRRMLLERLEDEWGRADEHSESISVVLVNVDGFKAFNKAHGYLSGDEVLVEMSRMFRSVLPGRRPILGRFSGNEFLVVLPGQEKSVADGVALTLQGQMEERAVFNRATDSSLSVSVGTHTAAPRDQDSMHELIDGAHKDLKARRAMG
jgi:diguanylate cyclase (GGDEF)-like protein